MPTVNQAIGKKLGYFFSGIIVVTTSSLASLAIASTGVFLFARAIVFIAKPFNAFIPGIISTLFIAWAIIYALILHYQLTSVIVLFTKKKIIKLLKVKRSELALLKRTDPFRKIWLWGYLLPILFLLVLLLLNADGP